MNFLGLLFLIVFITTPSGGVPEHKKPDIYSLDSETPTKRLIVDTDAGSDDAVAILSLLGAERLFGRVHIEMITAVHGNTNVDNVGRNLLKILKTANRLDIPVHKGASESILVTPETGDYFGKDGFGDFDFPDPPAEDLIREEHAVNALIKAVSLSPGQLTLVCLGPLTNIALATRLYPKFLADLKEIFILGGSDSGVGNIKPGVEFNFHVDPEAVHVVLSEAEKRKKTLNVLTWETASLRTPVEMSWRKEVLGTVNSSQVDVINNAERLTLHGDKWISSDAMLTSAVLSSEIIQSQEEYHVDVEVCGRHSRAALLVDYESSSNSTKTVRIIKRIDAEQYKAMLLQTLDGQTSGDAVGPSSS